MSNEEWQMIRPLTKLRTSPRGYKAAAVSDDPFQGKRYLCYYDRKLNQMHYLRNDNL